MINLPQKASSCKELHPDSNEKIENETSGIESSQNLPEAVQDCFQDTSFLKKMHNSFLLFIGRGSKYKLRSPQATPATSDNRKASSTLHLESPPDDAASDYHHSLPSKAKMATQKALNNNIVQKHSPSTPEEVANRHPQRHKFSYFRRETPSTEEETLLRQYLSLQQLAVSRRHCNQLRRIRDSLSGKTLREDHNQPSKEQKLLRNFLLDVGFVQYYTALNRHGYDLQTATHMDVLDLAAVGVCEPLHRMALKYELDQIKQPIEPLPSVPETVSDWLEGIGLPEYTDHFERNGFYCPLSAVALTKRDLQLMGIYMLGHRKKLVLALLAVNHTLASTRAAYQKKNSL